MEALYEDEELQACVALEQRRAREIVKFGDSKEDVKESRVHMITVNASKKRVDIVFRGSSTGGDWATNLNAVPMVCETVFADSRADATSNHS